MKLTFTVSGQAYTIDTDDEAMLYGLALCGAVNTIRDAGSKAVGDEAQQHQERLDRCAKISAGEYVFGGGGGGRSLTDRDHAERAVMVDYLTSADFGGMKKAPAEKFARSDTAWQDFAVLFLASQGVEDPDESAIADAIEAIRTALKPEIDAKEDAIRKARTKAPTSALKGLTLGQ